MPSGKKGRLKKPIARSLKAIRPSSPMPSAAAARTKALRLSPTGRAARVAPSASSRSAAVGELKNAAARAFCTDTSIPKMAAS